MNGKVMGETEESGASNGTGGCSVIVRYRLL